MARPPKEALQTIYDMPTGKLEKHGKHAVARAKHRTICQICIDEREDEFYSDYLQWTKRQKLAEKFTLGNIKEVDNHIQVYKLRHRRLMRSEAVYEAVIEEGLSRLPAMEFKPSDIINAAARLDKLTGRDIDRHSFENGPPKLIMIGIPTPGGVTEREEDQPAFEGKVLADALPSVTGDSQPEVEARETATSESTDGSSAS